MRWRAFIDLAYFIHKEVGTHGYHSNYVNKKIPQTNYVNNFDILVAIYDCIGILHAVHGISGMSEGSTQNIKV